MKNFLVLITLLFSTYLSAQNDDPIQQFKSARDYMISVQKGYYVMEYKMKYMTFPDTMDLVFRTSYRKQAEDEFFGKHFHMIIEKEGEVVGKTTYTGDELLRYDLENKKVKRQSAEEYGDEIKQITHNFTFYEPLTEQDAYPVPSEKALKDLSVLTYLGTDKLLGVTCQHYEYNVPLSKSDRKYGNLSRVLKFWLDPVSNIFMQYSEDMVFVMQGDTMHQFSMGTLIEWDLGGMEDENLLTLGGVPSSFTVEQYQPYVRPELLKPGTEVPDWTATDLDGNQVSLNTLDGKVILIDFFYKSCAPCMKAIPVIEELHKTYQDKGLVVIGIDPYDDPEKMQMKEFLEKRGVTYTTLYGNKEAPAAYNVSGYPTLYLLDADKKVIKTHVGFGPGFDKELKKDLEKLLGE